MFGIWLVILRIEAHAATSFSTSDRCRSNLAFEISRDRLHFAPRNAARSDVNEARQAAKNGTTHDDGSAGIG
jgi:hypothetical protein